LGSSQALWLALNTAFLLLLAFPLHACYNLPTVPQSSSCLFCYFAGLPLLLCCHALELRVSVLSEHVLPLMNPPKACSFPLQCFRSLALLILS
jgi:hypothetical protein